MPARDHKNPQPKDGHGAPLRESCHSAIAQRHAHHEKANGVIACVAKKIESVRLERCGPRREASSDLRRKHHGVDGQHHPQYAAVNGVPSLRIVVMAVVTAGGIHAADIDLGCAIFHCGIWSRSHELIDISLIVDFWPLPFTSWKD